MRLREKLGSERVDGYDLRDGIVFRRDGMRRFQMMLPREMEKNAMRMVHEKMCYLMIDKTVDRLKQHYRFGNMREKMEKFIRHCIRCILCTPPYRINERNLYNIPKKPVPFDTIHIDHSGPLPSVNSMKSTSTKEVKASLERCFDMYSRFR